MEKKAFVTKEMIEKIVEKYPTPFHIYDEKGIRENAKALKEAFAWNKGTRSFCREGDSQPVPDQYFERIWLRM